MSKRMTATVKKSILRLLRKGLSPRSVAKQVGCGESTVWYVNRANGYKGQPRKRRYSCAPQAALERLEQLIRDTDLPAEECMRRAGAPIWSDSSREIVHRHRDYINLNQWIDQAGNLRPNICTATCAAEKTGLSSKTVRRRIKAGLIAEQHAQSGNKPLIVSSVDLVRLAKIGKLQSSHPRLTLQDVQSIQQQAAEGKTSTAIAKSLPRDRRVSPRQIRRILDGTRWTQRLKREMANCDRPKQER